MSASRYYNMCRRGIGRPVEIRLRDGSAHRGIIERVTPAKVYIRPFVGRGRNYGGYGYGYYGGWGWGWWGLGVGFALGAIAAIAFWPWFW